MTGRTTTVHLAEEVVVALLEKAGVTEDKMVDRNQRPYSTWTMPGCSPRSEGGRPFKDYFWERDEAVSFALLVAAGIENGAPAS